MNNTLEKILIFIKSKRIFIFSFFVTILFFYPQIKSGAINSGILYSGDVLGYYLPKIIKAHTLIHTGSIAGAIDYSLFNGASEFYLSPNFFSYHPLLIIALVITPLSMMTLHFAGLILITMLALCSYLALYYSIKLLIKHFGFNFYIAAFVGVMYSFSYHSASALSQPPFIFSTIILPWVVYSWLNFFSKPNFYCLLKSVLPILFIVLGGYLPLGMATLGFAILIIAFKLIYLDEVYKQQENKIILIIRFLNPLIVSMVILSPFIYALVDYHHSTSSSGVPNLFYSAHQLADTPQNWMRAISNFILPGSARFHEFSLMLGLIPLAIFIIFIFGKEIKSRLSVKEYQLLTFCLIIYFMIALSTYGDYSALSDFVYYFIPQIGKMHIYQRFYLLGNFLLMIAVGLMLKAIISANPYFAPRILLGIAILLLIFVTIQIYSGESYIKGLVVNNYFLFEIFLLILFLTALTFPSSRFIFVIALSLAVLPSLNRYYDLAAGGNTLASQYKRQPIVLDGNERVRFLEFLNRFKDKEIIKYIDLTPMWNKSGIETFPKDYPYFIANQKKLSSYGGFTFYLSAKGEYISRMPVTGAETSVKPDWEYLKNTGADFAIASQQNIDDNQYLKALMQGIQPQDIYHLPGGIFAIPLKFPDEQKAILFDNGFFKIMQPQKNIKAVNLALNKKAQQSGTVGSGNPQLAVDGNPDGNFTLGSVTHSSNDPNAWLDIDLGSIQNIDAVRIWNRTDCCGYRLNNYYVFVSDKPFMPNDTVSILKKRSGTFNYVGAQVNPKLTINTGRIQGRYVRIQFDNHPAQADNYLSIAELEVLKYDEPLTTSSVSNVSFNTNFGNNSELSFESTGDVALQYQFWPNSRLYFSVNNKLIEFSVHDGMYLLELSKGSHIVKLHYVNWPLRLFVSMMILFAISYSIMFWPKKLRSKLLVLAAHYISMYKLKICEIFRIK